MAADVDVLQRLAARRFDPARILADVKIIWVSRYYAERLRLRRAGAGRGKEEAKRGPPSLSLNQEWHVSFARRA